MMKSRIAIVAGEKPISLGFKSQLESIFGNEIEIVILNLNKDPEYFLGFDLILVSSSAIYDEVKKKAPLNAKIITVIRNINTLKLYKVFNIESGSRVLVVSNYLDTARETIDLLNEVGLNHIKYIPYCPESKMDTSVMSSVDLAITAGAPHIVPKGINKIVDLGLKVIDISTVMEIMMYLGLSLERINVFTLRYMKEFIALNRKIGDLRTKLAAVLDASTDGIIAMDLDENIIFKNSKINMVFPHGEEVDAGENLSKLIKNTQILNFIRDFQGKKSDVFKLNKKDIMVYKNYLEQGGKVSGTVVSFSNVSMIQDMEKEIRRKLSPKGNIAKYDFSDIIGKSKSLKGAMDMAKRVAKTDLSALLLGENGTGKELIAQAIHKNSTRSGGPFVAVNFAALPENLIESELFGYEEGSFTGAKKGGKPGLFELAHMGTIFLDEIGDAPLSLQARLLRVIQEKEVLRVGGTNPIHVDVRILSATNRDLKDLIRKSLFRKDLYYRLNTITIRIPSLRERKADIPYIMDYYMNNLNATKTFTDRALKKLMEYNWPGNVRELENLTHYVVEMFDDDIIDVEHLPMDIIQGFDDCQEDFQETEDIADIMARKGNVRIYTAVLEELEGAEKLFIRASRSYLVDRLSMNGIPVTDNILRRIMRELEELQCVHIGNTKQGTQITPKGKEALERLSDMMEQEDYIGANRTAD